MSGDLPVPADYDGDGKADLGVWRASEGRWYVLQSSNGAWFTPVFGLADDIPVPADYDGDGKTDVAVWRPSTGMWCVRQSSDGAITYQQWGLDGDVPVPGDYDGDHKTDIAVWRPSDTIWYIMKSSDGSMMAPQWGLSTDIPARGDYNGDGLTDVAVFRPDPTTGEWYVLETTSGTFYLQQQLGDESVMPVAAANINAAPVSRPGGPYTGRVTLPIQFDGSRSSDDVGIKNYEWDYGDGHGDSGATLKKPQHSYESAGKYTVKLKVTDIGGRSATASTTAQVNDPIPADGLSNLSYDVETNRLTAGSGFEYDAAGNQTKIKRAGTDNPSEQMEYDAAGRMVTVKDATGAVLQRITYGSSTQRLMVEEVSDSSTSRTYYVWGDEADVISEYGEVDAGTVVDASPAWTKSYVYLGGRLLANIQPNGSGEAVQYHHPDRLGTRLITNASDSSVVEQVTLPFGTALDSESSAAAAATTNRRFTSYDRCMKTGLDYAVNRHYDSQQGRFMQVDPIGMGAVTLSDPQTLNLYAYCANDPVNRIDPSGLGFFSFLKKAFALLGKAIKVITVVAAVVAIFVGVLATAGTLAPLVGVAFGLKMFAAAAILLAGAFGPPWLQKAISVASIAFGLLSGVGVFGFAERDGEFPWGRLAFAFGILQGLGAAADQPQKRRRRKRNPEKPASVRLFYGLPPLRIGPFDEEPPDESAATYTCTTRGYIINLDTGQTEGPFGLQVEVNSNNERNAARLAAPLLRNELNDIAARRSRETGQRYQGKHINRSTINCRR